MTARASAPYARLTKVDRPPAANAGVGVFIHGGRTMNDGNEKMTENVFDSS